MATDSATGVLPEGVFEHEGRLWRRRPGASSTFEDNVAARRLFIDVHAIQFWNPWEFEEGAEALERAEEVMEEWERTEPGFRRKTKRQLAAEMARWDRDFDRKQAQREKARQDNLKRYDANRYEARPALLENQSILAHKVSELYRMRSGGAFPAMDPTRRSTQVAELEQSVQRLRAEVERLTPVVGDPENVVDHRGQLPADRRRWMLHQYRERRIADVNELRARLPQLDDQIKNTADKAERSRLRAQRDVEQWHLDKLLAVPRLEAEDMCADCPTPAAKHGWVNPPADSPCPAWPGWGSRLREVHRRLEEMATRDAAHKAAAAPPAPKPEPLAVVPSGLPIAEVVQRLQELQAEFPEADVRRGRANRWELWPQPARP